MTLHVFLGHDDREQEAYDVCVHSILRRAQQPLGLHGIKHRDLRARGLFKRRWLTEESGQMYDMQDGRPFSTQFSHSRFLVPALAAQMGLTGWALFCDCDFLWLVDPSVVLAHADETKAVMVCQHVHLPANETKMDGCIQSPYHRKNWSSLILWNLDHPSNQGLTPQHVNTRTGRWLHNFGWLNDAEIGALPLGYNFLVGHTSPAHQPYALHFTDGGPWIDGWQQKPDLQSYDDMWCDERMDMLRASWPATQAQEAAQ